MAVQTGQVPIVIFLSVITLSCTMLYVGLTNCTTSATWGLSSCQHQCSKEDQIQGQNEVTRSQGRCCDSRWISIDSVQL